MTKQQTRLGSLEWLLSAAIALLGSLILFDTDVGINWGIWVALAVLATLSCRRSGDFTIARQPMLLGLAATITAGAAARTTDTAAHVGIFWLTAFLLAAFLYCIPARDGGEIRLLTLIKSPFLSLARVALSAIREVGLAARAAPDSSSRAALRRIVLVAPVVLLLLVLLGGADPVIHSAIHHVEAWLPGTTISGRAFFFGFLFLVMIGACSRLPNLNFGLSPRELHFRIGPSPTDGMILVGSTLATLVAFLILQTIYFFVQLPSQIGNGITYAEYARRGFGQLCVVVTIVAAVILLAEKFRDPGDTGRTLRRMEFALIAAAALILLSAQRRVILYEHAYGYTVARVHATAYIVLLAGFLILLAQELRRGAVTPTLGRRSSAFALAVIMVILYWNDQAWIMNRNIDRVRLTGKFDVNYAARLSPDAFPALTRRKNELPPATWDTFSERATCEPVRGPFEWYEWNSARSAASSAREAVRLPEPSKCSAKLD